MSRPWFPFYVGDYMRDTGRLSTEAHGAYLLLMLDYWPNGAPPDDDETLATITKLPKRDWLAMRPRLQAFFKVENGRWNHPRIDKERALADEKHQKRVDAGGKGGKAKANGKHNPSNARLDDKAMLYQPQPQSHSEPKPDSEKGESNSPSKTLRVIEGGEDRPIPIDESYEPSDRAIEYAYSLGMKKPDLNAELSKFVAMSMAARAVSFNPDMSFKVWCDRWLEFKRKGNPDWKPAPEPVAAPQEPYVIVVENTTEAACWAIYNRENRRRPLFFCQQILPSGATAIGARCPTLFPPGFDEQTGERLSDIGEVNVA